MTLVREDIIKKLGLKCRKKGINISTVIDKAEPFRLNEVDINVSSSEGELV